MCGAQERYEETSGRFFHDMNKAHLKEYVGSVSDLEIKKIWYTKDVRVNCMHRNG